MFACLLACLFLLAFSDCKLNFRLQMKDLKAEILTFKTAAAEGRPYWPANCRNGSTAYVVESLKCSYHCGFVWYWIMGHNHFPKIQSGIEAPAVCRQALAVWVRDGRNTDCLFRKPLNQMNVAGFYALIHAGVKKQQLKTSDNQAKWICSIFFKTFFFIYIHKKAF